MIFFLFAVNILKRLNNLSLAAVDGSKKKKNVSLAVDATPSASLVEKANIKEPKPLAPEAQSVTRLINRSSSVPSLKENCFAVIGQDQSRFFQCRNLVGHTGSINSMEFSHDGSFIVSGSGDTTVRLWSFGGENPIAVHYQMKTKHESSVNSVAVSSGNSRIVSGGADSKVFIHDART